MIMRKCLAIGLLFCALCALAGCSDEEVVTQFNEVPQAPGEKVLTSEADLQGTRTFGEDGYVGTYHAQYDGFTGGRDRVRRHRAGKGRRKRGDPLLYPDPCGRDGAGAVPEWGTIRRKCFATQRDPIRRPSPFPPAATISSCRQKMRQVPSN